MPSTFYLDYENGSDANDGSSWANAWKTITGGATAARIAPGDTIRIAKSSDPTSVGTAQWTNTPNTTGGLNAGTKSISAATNASPVQITASTHGYSTGDIVFIYGVVGNTAANGVWIITYVDDNNFTLDGSTGNGAYTSGGTARQINSACVKLNTAVTQRLDLCDFVAPWTAGSDVTVTANTTFKKYSIASLSVATASGCTTARQIAKCALPSALDLSGCQQISFWIRNNTTALAAGDLQIRLYDDAACTSLQETLSLPAIASTSQWVPITINKGSAMYNGIQGLAIYTTVSMASKQFYFQNFIACKAVGSADSLNLQSLIGKSSSATNGEFYPIAAIDGKIVYLAGYVSQNDQFLYTRGYCGTTESVTTYKRETIKVSGASQYAAVQAVQDSGNAGSYINFEGGYNTGTSSQDGLTFFDGLTSWGYGISNNSTGFVNYENIIAVRYTYGILINGSCSTSSKIGAIACGSGGIVFSTTKKQECSIDYCIMNAHGVQINNAINIKILSVNNIGNSGYGINFSQSSGIEITDPENLNNGSGAITILYSSNNIIKNHISNYNGFLTVNISVSYSNIFINSLFSEVTEMSIAGYEGCKLFSHDHDQTAGNHYIFTDYGYIKAASTTREGGTGSEWRMYVTNSSRSSVYPLKFTVAKVACSADAQVTVKAYVKKSHASDISASLVCPGGQIAGVTSDVTDTKADDTDWEELQIQFTPTEAGVVEIEVWAWWVANTADEFVIIEDMTITQA
ncbi:MAG TPA: hypothetical protein P5531_04070 [Bacteroidales bacterium]|nr:hypothetical protein [Bacteroidales bacterium]